MTDLSERDMSPEDAAKRRSELEAKREDAGLTEREAAELRLIRQLQRLDRLKADLEGTSDDQA